MIRKFRDKIVITTLFSLYLLSSNSYSLSPEYQKQLQIGCYGNSKQYLGPERAREYCTCTIEMLNKKFNDKQLDELFNKKPEEIMKSTEFAATYCEKNKKAS